MSKGKDAIVETPRLLRYRITKAINESLGQCNAVRDFQVSKVYQYHADLHESLIAEDEAHKIVKQLDRLWGIKTVALFPEIWKIESGTFNSYGWTIGKRHSALQVPHSMLKVSYVIHEHCHGVIESYQTYLKKSSPLKEPGHGPLFCGVLAYNMSKIEDKSYLDIVNEMEYYGIRVVDESTVMNFKKLFKQL